MMLSLVSWVFALRSHPLLDSLFTMTAAGGGSNGPDPLINVVVNNLGIIITAVVTGLSTWVVARVGRRTDSAPPPVTDGARANIELATAYLKELVEEAKADRDMARDERDQAIRERDQANANYQRLLMERWTGGPGAGNGGN